MNKPSLKDRRRQETRDALYRAQERRDNLLDALVRNVKNIRLLKLRLKRLDVLDPNVISKLPLSVVEGRLLEQPYVKDIIDRLDDDISDLSGAPCK